MALFEGPFVGRFLFRLHDGLHHVCTCPAPCWSGWLRKTWLFVSGKAVHTTMLPTVYLKQRLPCSSFCVELKAFSFLYSNCWSFPSLFPELMVIAHLPWAFPHCGGVLIRHMGFYVVWIRTASSTQEIKIWSRKKHSSVFRTLEGSPASSTSRVFSINKWQQSQIFTSEIFDFASTNQSFTLVFVWMCFSWTMNISGPTYRWSDSIS